MDHVTRNWAFKNVIMKLMWGNLLKLILNLFTLSPTNQPTSLSFYEAKKKLISTCSNKKWLNMIVSLLLNIVLKLLYCEFITRSTRKCLLLQFSRSASSLSRNTFWFDYAIVKNSLAETRQYCIASC